MQRLIIKDDGDLWQQGLDALRLHLASTLSDKALLRFLVEQMGFIAIDISRASATIALNFDTVSEPGLARVFYWLDQQRPEKVVLIDRSPFASQAHFLLGPWARALPLLARLSLNREADRARAMISDELGMHQLAHDHALGRCLRFWIEASATGALDERWGRASEILGGRLVAIKAQDHGGGTVIARVGTGLPVFAQVGLGRTIGLRVEDQPDTRYGRTCANTYGTVLASGKPKLERIDALVRWPGVGQVRRRYVRLLLPFNAANQEKWLLSATSEDDSIDLRRGTG
jgi:hypothetical protein